MTVPLGGSGGASLTVPVDRYFEAGGKRFFLDFGGTDPNRATLLRIVESAGYRRITIGGADDFRTVAGKLLDALGIRSDYLVHAIVPAAGGAGGTEAAGYLIVPGEGGDRTFLTDTPLEKTTLDQIGDGRMEIR